MKLFLRQFISLVVILNASVLWADGTRNFVAITDTIGSGGFENEASLCLFNAADGSGRLGTVEAIEAERFYIHIDDPVNERIYLGFDEGYSAGGTKYFRVKAPDGTILLGYTAIPTSGTGFIPSYKSVYEGPSPTTTTGGYTPIIVVPDASQSGDYYIEFNTTNSGDVMSPAPSGHTRSTIFKLFDFSVGKLSSSPSGQKTHDLIEGRFYSYVFPMYNLYDGLGLNSSGVNVDYYIYHTTDQVVTKLHWEKVIGGGWTIGFNSTGPGNTGIIANDRKSSEDASLIPVGTHRVFFSAPDEDIYTITTITPDFEFEDYRFDCDEGGYSFFFNINRPGRLEMLLEFGSPNNEYDPGTTDRLLFVEDVTLNRNKVNWDGKDGLGNDADTASFNLKMVFSIGATNNPMFDVEQVVGGLTVDLISPAPSMFGWPAQAKLYFDDTNITGLGNYDYIGCSQDCHIFSGANYGDRNWMNTWWTAYEETVVEVVTTGPSAGIIPIDTIYGVEPSTCSGTDGSVTLEGLIGGDDYDISYDKDHSTIGPTTYAANGSGEVVISGLGTGTYENFVISQSSCGGPADFSYVISCLVANDSIMTCSENPGGSTEVNLPSTYFTGNPYLSSNINKISFEKFPQNADAITIGGTSYTSATFGSGVEINANVLGNPSQSISIDPKDDINNVIVYFKLKDDGGNVSNQATLMVPFPNISISGYVTQGTCNTSDGAISVSVSGGNPPYSYLWTPGFMTQEDISNLDVGTYIIEVTDAGGCTAKDTFHVQANPITGTCAITEESAPSIGSSTSAIGEMSGIITSTSGSGMSWSNPGRVSANDGSNARVNDFDGNSGNPMESDVLDVTDFDFSTIPANATIDGILLNIERYRQSASGSRRSEINDLIVSVLKSGVPTSENKASSSYWPTSAAIATYGGSTDDLWGDTWTVPDIKDPNFGVRYQIEATGGTWKTDTYIDYIELIVYYTVPAGVYDDASSYTFSTALFDQATEYIWSSPSGAIVISGQGTSVGTFDFSNLGAGIYQICVTPRNECDVAETCCEYIEVVDSAGTLTINGNVFQDNDGSENPNKVDGYGIDSLSGNPIYVYLVTRSDNLSIDVDTVKANGSFQFADNVLADTDYKIVISTTYQVVGIEPTPSLPPNWYFAGEIDNNFDNNLLGNDVEVSIDLNSETNGELWVESKLVSNSESNLNFGVTFAYSDGNTMTCPSDSVLSGCNPSLPPVGTPLTTTGPWWQITNEGNDYPGTLTSISACQATSTVKYWTDWKIFGFIGLHTDTCEQVFTYQMDTLPPALNCPNDTILLVENEAEYITNVTLDSASAFDPCGMDTLYRIEVDTFFLGSTEVYWYALDLCGNLDSCLQMVYVNGLHTDSVTTIVDSTALMYGTIPRGNDIVEFGFYYSSDTATADLVEGVASSIQCYSAPSSPLYLVDTSFSCSAIDLVNRSAYYFRAYMKNSNGEYAYGKKLRFVSERRDFSLVLDGSNDCVIVDKESTNNYILDWGSSDNAFSIDFWMKRELPINSVDILISTLATNVGYELSVRDGMISLTGPEISIVRAPSQIIDTEWHHVALTYASGLVGIYVDDSLYISTMVESGGVETSLTRPLDMVNCFVGARYRTSDHRLVNDFRGHFDALRFWNVALTAEQISELLYDNVQEGTTPNTVEGVASGNVIPSLRWDNLSVSMGFNVMSTDEGLKNWPNSPLVYENQDQMHAYPFFHNDARLSKDKRSFNAIAVGHAKPSPYLPRVNWRHNATGIQWTSPDNWGGYAYPGQGVAASTYPDVSSSIMVNDSVFCKYTVINSSTSVATVTASPPEVQVLVDRHDDAGNYSVVVDTTVTLTVLQGIKYEMFSDRVDAEQSNILVEDGSFEVHDE